jgi:hypothetical protein
MSINPTIDTVIAQVINPEFIIKTDDILNRTMTNGSLLISGTGGSGKTFASMWLMRRLMQSPKFEINEYRISIIEPCLNYRYKFDAVPYINYATTNVIPKDRAIIIDMNGMTPKAKRDGLNSILTTDFVLKQKLKIENNGINRYKNFYMLDELHNSLGRYALVGDKGAELLDVFTECRNFDMYIIGVTRRLADISTQYVESSRNFLLGKMAGENDLKKIEKMLGHKVSNAVANLKPRSFIFFDTEDNNLCEIGFPEFIAIGLPFEVKENMSQGYVKQW